MSSAKALGSAIVLSLAVVESMNLQSNRQRSSFACRLRLSFACSDKAIFAEYTDILDSST